MRFAVAVVALLAQSSKPSVEAAPFLKKKHITRGRQEYARRKALEFSITPAVQECDPTSAESALACPTDTYCVSVQKESTLGGVCSRLPPGLLINTEHASQLQECNPTSPHPDIGILSCGDEQLCVQASTSSLGGLCVLSTVINTSNSLGGDMNEYPDANFDLEEDETINTRGYYYCDPASPYYGFLDCDCSGFDVATQEGSFVCSYSYCFGVLSECCEQTCADIQLTYVSHGNDAHTYETCYDFTTPYRQTFCYGQTIGSDFSACFGSFNGQACESCQISSDAECMSFACSPVGMEEPFCVEDFYPPVLTSCYAECSTCGVCPHETVVPNPDTHLGFSNFTCGYVDYLGHLGMWGGPKQEECINVRTVAQETCCVPTTTAEEETTSPPVLETTAPTTILTTPESEPQETTMPETTVPPTDATTTLAPQVETVPPSVVADPTAAPVPMMTPAPTEASRVIPPPPLQEGPATCSIRIQTAKCEGLLKVHADVIPCSCQNQCITFINNEFEKCDAGTSIAGSGSIVAGCTFDMAFDNAEAEVECQGSTTIVSSRGASAATTTLSATGLFLVLAAGSWSLW